MLPNAFLAKTKANPRQEGRVEMDCPKAACRSKINEKEQKKVESNFYFCKDCGTVVYRRERK